MKEGKNTTLIEFKDKNGKKIYSMFKIMLTDE